MENQSVVDPVIVQYRSPAKMARSAMGQDQVWVTPDKKARQKSRETFRGLKRFKIDEELPAKELKWWLAARTGFLLQEVVAERLTEWERGAWWALALVILETEFGSGARYLVNVDL